MGNPASSLSVGAEGPSQPPQSRWRRAHHCTETAFAYAVSWAGSRETREGRRPTSARTARRDSVTLASRLPPPASRFGLIPSARLPPGLIVEEEDDRPDLPLR